MIRAAYSRVMSLMFTVSVSCRITPGGRLVAERCNVKLSIPSWAVVSTIVVNSKNLVEPKIKNDGSDSIFCSCNEHRSDKAMLSSICGYIYRVQM